MISRTVRTLTAVSALVLGFGPAAVQAADANNSPYAKYVDCGASKQRTSCIERGEVMNFAQLRDMIAAAMYRDAMERRRQLQPDSDSIDRLNSSSTYNSTTIRSGDSRSSTPNSSRSTRPESRSAQPVAVRYERGIDNQGTEISRLVFKVRGETDRSSSYSVKVSPETGRYIESTIIRKAQPAARTSEPTTRTPEPIIRTSETLPTTAETEVDAPLDMQEVFVSQEMIPVSSNTEVFPQVAAAPTSVPASSPSQPAAASPFLTQTTTGQAETQTAPAPAGSQPTAASPFPTQTTAMQVEMQPAPAPVRPTATYLPPQVVVAETSVENQPMTFSYYTVQPSPTVMFYTYTVQQPTVQYYRVTVPGNTTTVDATPVITLRVREQGDSQTTTTTEATTEATTENTEVQPYMLMISSTETVNVVPQQAEAPVNVLAAFRDGPQAATPGENVRDQTYSGMNETSVSEPSSSSPSNDGGNDDGGDDNGDGGDDGDGDGDGGDGNDNPGPVN